MAIFRTCCIMFDQVSAELLDQYAAKIRKYAKLYGPKAWPLVYQVEARTRSEHAPRIRRRLAEEKTAALKAGKDHPYDPLKPWEEVFAQLVLGEDPWWRGELERPAIHISTGVTDVQDYIDEDAPVKKTARASASDAPTLPSPVHPPPKRSRERDDDSGDEWLIVHRTNNKGVALCKGFQKGSCRSLTKGSRCAKDGCSAHQCSV